MLPHPRVPLKFLTSITSGGTPKPEPGNWNGDIPFVTPPDLNGLDGKTVQAWGRTVTEVGAAQGSTVVSDAVLLSCRAPIGHIGTVRESIAFNQGCKALKPPRIEDLRYLAYALVAERKALDVAGRGTTFMELSTTDLSGCDVSWPQNKSERQRIADYLDRETGEIDTMIAKLDELARALRERAADVPTLFALGQNAAREDDLHSPLAGIPDHWDRTRFGFDFTESTERNGDDPPGPLLSISEYRGVELNTRSEGQQASLDVSNYRVVRPNQLAANMMWLNHGGLGVSKLTGYISPDYKAFWISKRFNPRYVHHLFRSSRYVAYFQAIGTGVRPNAQRVTKTALDMMPVPLPPLADQRRIADHLDEVTSRIDTMLAKVSELKSLLVERRAALITDVVTGRKEVA